MLSEGLLVSLLFAGHMILHITKPASFFRLVLIPKVNVSACVAELSSQSMQPLDGSSPALVKLPLSLRKLEHSLHFFVYLAYFCCKLSIKFILPIRPRFCSLRSLSKNHSYKM